MTRRERELAEGILGDEHGRQEIAKALLEITHRTAANADGDVAVGLSLHVDGAIESVGATSPSAETMDRGQAEDDDGPCVHALRTGETVGVVDYATDERWPASSRRAVETGVRSSLSLPLVTGKVVLGALNVYSDAPAAFGKGAAESLTAFAQQATTSLYLLGQLQAERADSAYVTAFSHTIQASLRTVLPDVAGLELLGTSVPSSPHAAVGGDWYDAFVLPDGSVGLVIGDVMGHGIASVTAMAQIRTMVRTAARAGLGPDAVLRLTDQLATESGVTETATAFHANLRTTRAGAQLRYTNAGHPYPLVRLPDGEVIELSDGRRPLIGVLDLDADPSQEVIGTAVLPAGSLLLLYTDGLLEGRGVDDDEAAESLRAGLALIGPDDSLDELFTRLLSTPDAIDDTTVFAVRVRGSS